MKKTSIVINTEAAMAEEGEGVGVGGNEQTIEMYDANYFQQSTNVDDLVMIDLDEEEEDGDNEGIEQQQSNNVEEPSEVESSSTSTAQSSPVSCVAGSKRSLGSSFHNNESSLRMKQQQRKKNSCRWIIMGIAGTILVACGLGIGLGLFFTKDGDSNEELSNQESTATSVPTSTTQRSQLQDLVMKYSFSSLDIPSVFDNSTSPQSRAVDYLMDLQSNHPNSLLDEEEFVSTQYGLAVLYYATGGDDEDSSSSWKQSYGFLQSNDYCKWNTNNPENSRSAVNVGVRTTSTPSSVVQGVLCNDDGKVISIQLVNIGLTGYLPQELMAIKKLETLVLSSNDIQGALPNWKFTFDNGNNDYNLPPPSLRHVDLQGNNIEGSVPVDFLLYSYEWLNLSFNQLTGTLPVTLSFLTDLKTLNLASNDLAGQFPSIIYLEKLHQLILSDNQLSGTIPEIWPQSLNFVDSSNNQLTGTLPLSAMTGGMQFLNINNNRLEGKLPWEELITVNNGGISNLIWFRAANNRLTGRIPWDIVALKLPALQVLDIASNNFSGSLDLGLGILPFLLSLKLDSNSLTGTIPTHVGRFSRLRKLDLANNRLEGTLPTQLGQLQELQELTFENNWNLQGTIPVQLGFLDRLQILTFDSNHFHGSVDFLCPKERIQTLSVDCDSVSCSCCDGCGV